MGKWLIVLCLVHLLTTMRNGLSMAVIMFEYGIEKMGRKHEMDIKLSYVEFLQARKTARLVAFKIYI
jgi:hypothetical protein